MTTYEQLEMRGAYQAGVNWSWGQRAKGLAVTPALARRTAANAYLEGTSAAYQREFVKGALDEQERYEAEYGEKA